MTRRILLLSLITVIGLSAVTFYNDMVLKNTHLIGNFLPVSVFGTLLVLVLAVNPLLQRLRGDWPLTRRELATWTALVLFACYPLGRGLGHYFTTFLMLPWHMERTRPGWQASPARLNPGDVPDVPALQQQLWEARERRPEGDPLRVVAERLPADLLQRPVAEPGAAAALLDAINEVLADPGWLRAVRLEVLPRPLPRWIRTSMEKGADQLSPERRSALHRDLFDLAAGSLVIPRRPGALERVHPRILADPSRNPELALEGFVTGLGRADDRPVLARVPWDAWMRTLTFWLPLLFTMSALVIGLALVLHRQWATHEHLPYPIAEFASAVFPENGSLGSVLRNRLFWVGFLPVFALHMINYGNAWFPEYVIPVSRDLDFMPLLELMPVMRRGGPWKLFNPTVYFTAIGFAYFLASDVSLSLGLAPYLFCLLSGLLVGYGIPFSAGYMQPSIENSIYTGAGFATFLTIVYSGRHYLRSAFARALGLPARDVVEPAAVWGARVALVAFVLFVAQLVAVEIEWPLAVLYTLSTVMIFTVMSRLLAESGVFFFKPNVFSCVILWNFLGSRAIGPEQHLMLAMISSLLLIDPRECLMPFAVTSLQIADRAGLRLGRIGGLGAAATVLALLVMIPSTLYWQYRDGAIQTGDGWTAGAVPTIAVNINVTMVQELEAQGALESARQIQGWRRFREASPKARFLIPFFSAAAAVFLFTFLRHRFARFPLHPVLFLFGIIYEARMMGFSFLLGWLIKSLITGYGGARAYQRLKPMMIGLVGGELMASLVPLVVSIIYSSITGRTPTAFRIMPG